VTGIVPLDPNSWCLPLVAIVTTFVYFHPGVSNSCGGLLSCVIHNVRIVVGRALCSGCPILLLIWGFCGSHVLEFCFRWPLTVASMVGGGGLSGRRSVLANAVNWPLLMALIK
jgi:hypothetical protein